METKFSNENYVLFDFSNFSRYLKKKFLSASKTEINFLIRSSFSLLRARERSFRNYVEFMIEKAEVLRSST